MSLLARCAVLLVLVAGGARADTPAEREALKKVAEREALRELKEGMALFKDGRLPEARDRFVRAQKLAPERPNPYRMLGLTEARLGRCAEARRYIDEFLRRVPPNDPRSIDVSAIRDSCAPSAKVQDLAKSSQQGAYGVAVDSNVVVWGDSGNLYLTPIGGNPTLFSTGNLGPRGIAIDNGTVYWVTHGDGAVWSLAGGGGTRVAVTSGIPDAEAIAVMSGRLFFTSGTQVLVRPINMSTTSDVVLDNQAGPANLAFDSTFVFWTNQGTAANGYSDGSVVRATLQSSGSNWESRPVAVAQKRPWGIAVDDQYVYWASNVAGGAIHRVRKTSR